MITITSTIGEQLEPGVSVIKLYHNQGSLTEGEGSVLLTSLS
jgi:hypothetical protein